jgi:thioredoxin reductase (NADPH)
MTDSAMEVDCLVVGGGPAGLTAAIYLGRYRRKVVVVDKGNSRAALIPLSHNFAGFPRGIGGTELLARLREQVCNCNVEIIHAEVTELRREGERFIATIGDGLEAIIRARTVLLATGIIDKKPDIPNWREAVAKATLRFCPVCDAFEAIDRNVAMYAPTPGRVRHALFMRTYTDNLTLFCHMPDIPLQENDRRELEAAGIRVVEEPVAEIMLTEDLMPVVRLRDGSDHRFDMLYPMMGDIAHSELGTLLGARCSEDRALITDTRQRTSVPGLYAAGDVVDALNQVNVAIGHAAVAATDIHRYLREQDRA